ncbi:anti-sigma factor [Ciceribacter sp. L1K22]|uniref:anti-sigma factor n=1 Tax=Ciceribacter sp. L1K22 TaxID=2820275 RepID=UPI001ABE6C3C|nr:anti-sigma factor [Ciceribacter sp. L1K22]MBO3758841.1 anti-sigma factor [Ciceribacter sp. L1K22]
MTGPDQSKGDRSRDEVLAGEYVLGALDTDARREVEERMRRDRQFAAIVWRWEENLSQFSETYAEEPVPAQTFAQIEARLFGPAVVASVWTRVWQSLPFWRGLSLAGFAGLAAFTAFAVAPGLAPEPAPLVAEMAGEDGAVNLLARYDERSGRLSVTPVAAGDGAEKSLELWLIVGSGAPRSLGVLPQTGEGELAVPTNLRRDLAAGAVLAVSVEPLGGSPTGRATGPVIAVGPIGF